MFDNRTRGLAITVFSTTVFTGPLLAPFIGGFIIMNPNLGWRWTEYIVALMGFLAFGLDLVFLEETYPPVVLVEKAAEVLRNLWDLYYEMFLTHSTASSQDQELGHTCQTGRD